MIPEEFDVTVRIMCESLQITNSLPIETVSEIMAVVEGKTL